MVKLISNAWAMNSRACRVTPGSLTIRFALLIVSIFVASTLPVHAQNVAGGVAKDAARGSRIPRPTADALCAQLSLDEVTAIVGKNFERIQDKAPDKANQACKYGDRTEKSTLPVRYFSLRSSLFKDETFRKFVETGAKGKVVERDGVLVSHFRGNKFGADSIWFRDRRGQALELSVNSGISEDQAVALAKAAMD
jgi:hypothetical protein